MFYFAARGNPEIKEKDASLREASDIIIQKRNLFEVILVDDGSPDNCGAICDELAKNDYRIRVIHKNNGGLSDARNVGIEAEKAII